MSDLVPNTLYWGDCIEVLRDLPEQSVDMILVDPPYGKTRADWDRIIPLDLFWSSHLRVIKDNGIIVITASQPFSSLLVSANLKYFRYDLIWKKNKTTGYLNAKKMPLRQHEDILIFYKKTPVTYNPQKTQGHKPVNTYTKPIYDGEIYGRQNQRVSGGGQTDRYPTSIISSSIVNNDSPDRIHASQKPVDLFSWLIRTYSNPNEIILDSCIGSGTTAIAVLRERVDILSA